MERDEILKELLGQVLFQFDTAAEGQVPTEEYAVPADKAQREETWAVLRKTILEGDSRLIEVVMETPMDFALCQQLVEKVSDATSNVWDVGTEQNTVLANRLVPLFDALRGTSLPTQARIVVVFIDDVMHLDASTEVEERLTELVLTFLESHSGK